MPRPSAHATALARAFLAGEWSREPMRQRGRDVFAGSPRWLAPLVPRVLELYHRPPLDRPRELAEVIDQLLRRRKPLAVPRVVHWFTFDQEMGRMRWPVRPIAGLEELAEFATADIGHLQWLADARGWERGVRSERLRNYRYRWYARTGSVARLIEQPKQELKRIQRLVLREILDVIPAHDAAHGFRRGRSVVTHAEAHVAQRVVLQFDIEHFFASVDGGRIYGIFRTAGYPEDVAHVLTALCVNVVPIAEWRAAPVPPDPGLLDAHARLGRRLASPHLPQGAPTSPALASLVAFRLDTRLTALASGFDATYTRYADDLAFSGGDRLLAGAPALRAAVAEVVRDEGLHLNERKGRLMTSAGRQKLCGVVVNRHPNVSRREYDRLKATLHNAARRGPHGHDRERLLGRIAWVHSVNPRRGAKLRRAFERIDWSARG